MKFDLKLHNRNISEADLINDMIRVSKLLGKNSLTTIEYEQYGKYSSSSVIRRCGGWVKALKKAELVIAKSEKISAEELFSNLEEVWRKLGRQPHYRDMHKPISRYYGSIYSKRFGGWNATLLRFIEAIGEKDVLQPTELITNTDSEGRRSKNRRDVSWRIRFQILKKDNFKCVLCGNSPSIDPTIKLEVDHIVPWSKGGNTAPENLQTLCNKCNQGKSNVL